VLVLTTFVLLLAKYVPDKTYTCFGTQMYGTGVDQLYEADSKSHIVGSISMFWAEAAPTRFREVRQTPNPYSEHVPEPGFD
jgi:hypothetical protein